jgi:hypothetical protein
MERDIRGFQLVEQPGHVLRFPAFRLPFILLRLFLYFFFSSLFIFAATSLLEWHFRPRRHEEEIL